jgi:ParB family chromosome partitioning protein
VGRGEHLLTVERKFIMSHTIEQVPVGLIDPHPHNPRRDLGDLTELAGSIKAQGLQQNLLVTPWGPDGDRYRCIIGHRRLAAAKLAELEDVPCVINQDISAEEQIELMLLENVQRQDLSPVEEADGYQQLLDLGLSPATIAKKTGRNVKTVRGRIALLGLPEDVREKVHRHQASLEDAADLVGLEAHPAELAKVAKALGTGNFDWELKQARGRIKLDEELAPLFAEAERLGATRGEWDWRRYDTFASCNTVDQITALGELPEGSIYDRASYSAHVYIYAPKPADEVALREAATARGQEESAKERAARDEAYRAERERQAKIKAEGEQAWELREEFVVAFCGRKRVLAKESLAIVAAVGPLVITQDDVWLDPADLADWLGLADEDWDGVQDLMPAFDRQCPSLDRSLCLLVLLHLSCRQPTWSHAWQDRPLVVLYGLLEQLGYPVSDAERARLTPPADEDGDDGEVD